MQAHPQQIMGPLGKPLGQHLLEQPDLARHPALLGVQHMDRVQAGLPPPSARPPAPRARLASTSISGHLAKPHARPASCSRGAVVVGPHSPAPGCAPPHSSPWRKCHCSPSPGCGPAAGRAPQLIEVAGIPPGPAGPRACHHHIPLGLPSSRATRLSGISSMALGRCHSPLAHVDHGIGEVELDLDAGAGSSKTGEQFAHHAVPVLTGQVKPGSRCPPRSGRGSLLRLPGQGEDLAGLLVAALPASVRLSLPGSCAGTAGREGRTPGALTRRLSIPCSPQGIGSGGACCPAAPLHRNWPGGDIPSLAQI